MPRNEIDVKVRALEDLFKYNTKFQIPLYQRDYNWAKDHWEEFWNDLEGHFSKKIKSPYFFGTIMLVNESEKDELYTVVDGQQRLTISLILLIAFRDYFLEQGLDDEVEELNDIIYTEEGNTPRIKLNVYNQDFFSTKIMEEKNITEKIAALKLNKNIRKKNTSVRDCYILLAEKILKFKDGNSGKNKDLIKLYTHFLRFFTVVETIIIDLRKAYLIFESINHRGLKLNENDLVKNFLMMTINVDNKGSSQQDINGEIIDADNIWQRIREKLEQIKVTEDKFLRYYLMAFLEPTSKGEIYDTIKATYDDKEKVQDLLKKLEYRVQILASIKKPTLDDWNNDQDIVDDLVALDSLSDGGMYPIILLAKEHFDMNKMKKLIMLTTKLFFRAKTVCNINYTEIEILVGRICEMIRVNPETPIDDIQKEMTTWPKYPAEPEFEVYFKKLELNPKKAKYVLTELHYELIGGRHSASSAVSDKCDLEHIMPKNISGSEWEQYIITEKNKTTRSAMSEYHQENVNKLGNMTLLNKSKNRSLLNKSFEKKKETYRNDDLEITKRLADISVWDDIAISARQEKFFKLAKKIWDLKSV